MILGVIHCRSHLLIILNLSVHSANVFFLFSYQCLDRRTWEVCPGTQERGPREWTDGDPKAFDTHDRYLQVQVQRRRYICGVPLCHVPSHQTGLSD